MQSIRKKNGGCSLIDSVAQFTILLNEKCDKTQVHTHTLKKILNIYKLPL